MKQCMSCHELKPLSEFLRRTGRRSSPQSRRGTCRSCRKKRQAAPKAALTDAAADNQLMKAGAQAPASEQQPESAPGERHQARKIAALSSGRSCSRGTRGRQIAGQRSRPKPLHPPAFSPTDVSYLRETRQGTVWMRGRTDKGRRWHQEIDKELAVTLVKEKAAVIVNRHTIKRLFSNKDFRKYILNRDHYTCYFCGEYGDTIDHLLPRAKGGHTTPDNCVCACNDCNQSKADKDLDEFMRGI